LVKFNILIQQTFCFSERNSLMLSCDLIREKSGATIFGNNVFCLMEVDSTNTFILNMARSGAPEGTLVVADFQHSGRGKRGRQWFAPQGDNLTFSILLRPLVNIEYVQKITLAAAGTLADSIEEFFKQKNWTLPPIELKWPNDLLIGKKKLSGILTESILKDKQVSALAVGIGININTEIKQFPEELQHNVCSLTDFVGQRIIPEELLALFLRKFELDYEKWERNAYRDVVKKWKKRCSQLGQEITVVTTDGAEKVLFVDVNDDGYLLYQTLDGKTERLVSGEIKCF